MMVLEKPISKVLGSLEEINHNPELYLYSVLVCQSSHSLTKQSWSFGYRKRYAWEIPSTVMVTFFLVSQKHEVRKSLGWLWWTIIFESFRQIWMKYEKLHLPALPTFSTKPTPRSHSYQQLITNAWNAVNSDRDLSCHRKVLFGETSEAGEYQ